MNELKNRRFRIAMEVLIIAMGLILAFICETVEHETVGNVFSKVSYALIAAGVTSLLFEITFKDNFTDELRSYMRPTLELIDQRRNMDNYYKDKIEISREIDIVALTSEVFLRKCGEIIKKKIKEKYCKFRIIILSNSSDIWKYRLKDEPNTNVESLSKSFDYIEDFYIKLALELDDNEGNELNESKANKEIKGEIIVKYVERLPYIAYFRADNEITFGFYFSHSRGEKSHAVLATEGGKKKYDKNKSNDFYQSLRRHFRALWHQTNRENNENELVRITPFGVSINKEKLDEYNSRNNIP